MPYKVVNKFKDTQDGGREYRVGDMYPKGEHKPSEERINELSSTHPEFKKVFIEEIEGELSSNDNEGDLAFSPHTETDLKKLNKDDQVALIEQLNGDAGETKNEGERIALILKLQENEEK
ncbi:hypothetical protein M4D55_25025 [Metabacillus idriensis]|uniref:hypothetical protein n=1 Tax=Metabacillus idriensis TaxID=324768 RepID=UPI00174B031A|nr:hypothetical protein [Metabacillus idriensis]MCM3599004.1 hypothetical protein [Metabacillus idriensis]